MKRTKKNWKVCKYCGKKFIATHGNQQFCSRKCHGMYREMFSGNIRNRQKDTLCWGCKRSSGGLGCSWADKFIPVEGWKAKATEIRYRNKIVVNSYEVIECPLFIEG